MLRDIMLHSEERFRWICALLFMAMSIAPAQLFAQDANTTRLRHAAQLLSAGSLEPAEKELQSVLRASPDEYRALDLLGVIRILQHRETDAEDLFSRVVQIKPDFASGRAHLGLLYLQTGRTEEAIPQLREAVRLDPARTDASDALIKIWRDQAQAATKAGESATAFALLTEVRKLAPKNPEVQIEFGTAALQMSRWQDAVDAFLQTLQLRKNDPTAVYGLGRGYTGLSKFENARQQFSRYVVIRPQDASGHCALGMTLAVLERPTEARSQLERSIALTPAQTDSYFWLGLLDFDSNDVGSAATNMRNVLARDPDHAGALAALGRTEFEEKHYVNAVDLLLRAISNDDSLRVAHYYLGLTYARMGRKPESDLELVKATQLERQEAERQRMIVKALDPGTTTPPEAPPEKSPPR